MKVSHERTEGKEEWYTPVWITAPLGDFDLDPCAATDDEAPVHALKRIQWPTDGLEVDWTGHRVWLNPPYGRVLGAWLNKLAQHGNGVALVFARTDTNAFFDHVWGKATAIFFLKGRVKFLHMKDGALEEGGPAGAPSVLIAYDDQDSWENAQALKDSKLPGFFVDLTPTDVIWSGWKWAIRTLLSFGPLTLKDVYHWVEKCIYRPENNHVRAKVRQTLRRYKDLFTKDGEEWKLVA